MPRQIVIDIVGNADSFGHATAAATGAADKLDHGLRNSAAAGAVAGVAMSGVNAALDFVTSALSGASEAAKEDTASSDRLALALQNTGKAQKLSIDQIEAAISANQAKGVSDSEQRAGISDFLDKTKDATQALALNSATAELAAAKGLSYADAEAMIVSAAAGKTAALQKAGVELEKGASITEIATAVTSKYGGSLDAVALTQGGKSKIASEKMGEAMESIGRVVNKVAEVVMPALADALQWVMANVVPALGKAFEVIGPIIGGVFRGIGIAVGIFRGVIEGIVGVVSRVTGAIGSAFSGAAGIVRGAFEGITGVVRGVFNGIIGLINGVISAINSIQVHIHVGPVGYDFNGLNLGYIPRLHSGGFVPGAPGSDVLTMLQAGERVIPAGAPGGAPIVINVNGDVYGDGIEALADKLAMRLRLQGV